MTGAHRLDVLVTGATGKQGGAVARALLARGHKVRAFTRTPDSDAARALERRGAILTAGRFDDPASLDRALDGADAVFAMGLFWGPGGLEAETREGIALVDAARRAGTRHFIYTSIGSVDRQTGIPFYESKVPIERHVAESGLSYTILGPVFFMENMSGFPLLPALREGRLMMALPPGRVLQYIAVDNIGRFATQIFEQPERFRGRRIDVASDAVSGQEAADILSRVIGRTITYAQLPLSELSKVNEAYAEMFAWFDRVGYQADIDGLRREYPEIGWHRLEDWAKAQDWKTLLGSLQRSLP